MVTVAIVIATLGFVLRVFTPGPTTETADEPSWLQRSDAFRTALVTHDLAEATAAHHARAVSRNDTMPGVTTMWAGTIGRAVAVGTGELRLSANVVGSSDKNRDVLLASRAVVALWCSIALGLFVYLAWRLFGRGAALVAGVLLATEPWLVGHSDELHTDAMVTMFSAVSVLAFAVGLGMSRFERRSREGSVIRWGWLVVSGAFAALGVLTKLNALVLVLPGALVVATASRLHEQRATNGRSWREVVRDVEPLATALAVWLAVGIAVFVALWPAMWAAPVAQLRAMRDSLRQVGAGHLEFFLGRVSNNPGPGFYFVVFLFRATPWLFAGLLLAVGLCVAKLANRFHPSRPFDRLMRHLGHVPLWPLCVCLPYLATITWSAKKLDRYLLPVFPFVAVVVGSIISAAVVAVPAHRRWHNFIAVTAVAGAIALAINAAAQAPYAVAYVDPLVGGQRVADHAMLLGGNVGFERLGATIARERAGGCGDTVVVTEVKLRLALPCGQLVGASQFERADYVIISIDHRQRSSAGSRKRLLTALHQDAKLVQAVTIGGVTYAELWRVRKIGARVNAPAQ